MIEALDRAGVSVSAAFWFYEPEEERYRLVLATPVYDSDGPLEAYRVVQEVLDQLPANKRPSLTEINMVSPKNRIVQAIGKAVKTGPGIAGIRFARNTINGVYVDDAWIYRSN